MGSSFYNAVMTSSKGAAWLAVVLLFVHSALFAQVRELDGSAILATIETLASPAYEGRRTGTRGGLHARTWIADRFKTIGLASSDGSHLRPFAFTRHNVEYKDAANIVGLCKGTSGTRDMLVVTAHYDHVGVRDGQMYPGADDNASGVAVLLALAAHCVRAPFLHDTLFVAFDAEELGLQGARAFLANPPVAKERMALNVNLDMVGRSSRRELYAAGTFHWPALRKPLEAVATRAPVTLLFGHDQPGANGGGRDDWTHQSDHGVFHDAGIPFVYFGVENHRDYHKPSDTADRIDPVFLGQTAATILDALIVLDAAVPLGR